MTGLLNLLTTLAVATISVNAFFTAGDKFCFSKGDSIYNPIESPNRDVVFYPASNRVYIKSDQRELVFGKQVNMLKKSLSYDLDGNMSFRDESGQQIWNAGVKSNYALCLQNDGNLVIYEEPWKAVWSLFDHQE
ncbi:hypothetical protein HDU79_010457 [Rhizoclosmatium sp. JEL0117]|nr:hypothetical protein HDU99_002113 [Rhizoclosmatium hyalinum]KAJ3281814.1 hypothetical protein HDU79_010457 [Rhizoclosmatium sp. JEL0117]